MNLKSNFINKPWGHEIFLEKNKKFMFKQLYMKRGHQCSLQFHKKKIEIVYIVSGKLLVTIKEKQKKQKKNILKKKNTLLIKPKTIHRMKAISNCIYLEASTPELLDVVRLEDDYKRVR